jgi:rSAM/selenodomain-associated transferase 1
VPADRLLIFCKVPRPGRVKTRLVPPLAPDDAAALYAASLRDIIAVAGRERARVELWYDSEAARSYFEQEYPQVLSQPQAKGDAGERQRDAFERSFADGAERVVIIGCDSPTLPETHLNAAFDALREAPAAAGPAPDGGYYLIGINASVWPAAADLFTGIAWSGTDVLAQTLQRAADTGIELRVLPGWYDVDEPADLALMRRDAIGDSHVAQWLSEHPELK